MFYSQFILAKKGPLGTIWIAAHLERKLRKNQVADTDIGFSVDSILFPEVPIALRLSSHLLLGVVRIYSRKVNYLFDDCSEALLKIKQAFRSTAVDLPPEESTAPYHSITLPETFDLDDFELPDNDIFHGNYVDHHISSREQITLQDTMEGVVYSTSQFGLDERFGDGDTSGLDLDEELLMDKVALGGHTEVLLKSESSADPQASVLPITPSKKDEDQGTVAANVETTAATPSLNQLDDLDGDGDHVEYAQAPCTPGLWEEPNLPIVQETSAFDDHLELENHNLTESAVKENLENATSNSDYYNCDKIVEPVNLDPTNSASVVENGYHPGNPELNQLSQENSSAMEVIAEQMSKDMVDSAPLKNAVLDEEIRDASPVTKIPEEIVTASAVVPGTLSAGETCDEAEGNRSSDWTPLACSLTSSDQPAVEGMTVKDASLGTESICNPVVAGNMDNESGFESNIELSNTTYLDGEETPLCQTPYFSNNINMPALRPCTTHSNEPDVSTPIGEKFPDSEIPFQGEGSLAIDGSDRSIEGIDLYTSSTTSINRGDNIMSGNNQVNNILSFTSSDLPAPEKLLSVPEEAANVGIGLFPENTPDKEVLESGDGRDDGSITLAGKKRSFAESASTLNSNAVESLGVFGTKMTAESVPNDDDLLSSILAGRKSSMLKVRSTPPLEMTSTKRRRSAPRTGSSKRKVLLDDMMVLHGDTIRQQLTNTEDIRRIRKKAPCTRPEISMIQKQFWEDELFTEPIFTGVSMELASLHNQAYDLTEIRITQADASLESALSIQLVSQSDQRNVDTEVQPVDTLGLTVNQLSENNTVGSEFCGSELEIHPSTLIEERRSSEHEMLGETTPMEIDGKPCSDTTVAGETESSLHQNDLVPPVASDMEMYTDQPVSSENIEADASLQMNAPLLPEAEENLPSIEMDYARVDEAGDEGLNNTTEEKDAAAVNKVDFVLDRIEDVSVELTRNNEGDCLEHIETAISSTFSPETGGGSSQIPSVDQAAEEVREEQNLMMGSPFLDAEEYNAKNFVSGGIYGDELVIDPSFSVEVNVHSENLLFDDGEHPNQQEAYPLVTPNADVSAIELEDRYDSDYGAVGHDTEFLNVDDDDEGEADGEYVPNAEEAGIIDNSGWSTRTRAVAKYLQTLFDKESERGRNVLPVDNLLVGKTRKEASRMFFETLVLKTKDFIHVEQQNPYDNISLLPRLKLMKSDF